VSREGSGNQDLQSLCDSIRGFVWLGTPHRPVSANDPGSLYRALERRSERSLGGNVNCLKDAFNSMNGISEDFRKLGGEALPACSFYERDKTSFGHGEVQIPGHPIRMH
jgi:hypothetical protein